MNEDGQRRRFGAGDAGMRLDHVSQPKYSMLFVLISQLDLAPRTIEGGRD